MKRLAIVAALLLFGCSPDAVAVEHQKFLDAELANAKKQIELAKQEYIQCRKEAWDAAIDRGTAQSQLRLAGQITKEQWDAKIADYSHDLDADNGRCKDRYDEQLNAVRTHFDAVTLVSLYSGD
jgi:hypothetical protein